MFGSWVESEAAGFFVFHNPKIRNPQINQHFYGGFFKNPNPGQKDFHPNRNNNIIYNRY